MEKARKSLAVYDRRFSDALRLALPNADSHTFAKARNLEITIGAYALGIQSAEQDELDWAATKNSRSLEGAREHITGNEADLKPYLAEEARLFPHDAASSQRLAEVHKLAVLRQDRVTDPIAISEIVIITSEDLKDVRVLCI